MRLVLLFLGIVIIISFIIYKRCDSRNEKFSNYGGSDYFYFNKNNMEQKKINDNMVWKSQRPYLENSICDHGYNIFHRAPIDNKTNILCDKIVYV